MHASASIPQKYLRLCYFLIPLTHHEKNQIPNCYLYLQLIHFTQSKAQLQNCFRENALRADENCRLSRGQAILYTRKKGSIVNAPFCDRDVRCVGRLLSNHRILKSCHQISVIILNQQSAAEKSTHRQASFGWVVVGEKKTMWGGKMTKEEEKTIKGKKGSEESETEKKTKEQEVRHLEKQRTRASDILIS